ncbi:hypothetical protein [Janthinobacterium aquaticum]|uniref:hypothetical protein n=1 Tax=Janthinobacterium sp. FT58W TaxID=2654254 RepID=UPI0012650ADD|nr:hypothetical protein GCM43_24005 [Janthinobacterium sp. FT58W]
MRSTTAACQSRKSSGSTPAPQRLSARSSLTCRRGTASRRARCVSNYGRARWNCQRARAKTVSATCLIAREIYAPDRTKPIEWHSLNNCDADTLAQAQEMIDWYWARWEIDILFNVLKNVCKVEEL